MREVGCLVIFACLLRTIFAENSTWYQVNSNFQKKTCLNSDNALKVMNVPTSLTCSSICASDDDCKSFFYFPTSLRCDGCKQTYSTDERLKGSGEQTVYYNMVTHVTITSTAITTAHTSKGTSKPGLVWERVKLSCDPICGGRTISAINVTACFDYCDGSEGVKVSTVAIENENCYCSMKYDATRTSVCDTSCSGNTGEMCGGTWKISVYSKDEN